MQCPSYIGWGYDDELQCLLEFGHAGNHHFEKEWGIEEGYYPLIGPRPKREPRPPHVHDSTCKLICHMERAYMQKIEDSIFGDTPLLFAKVIEYGRNET